MRFMLGFSPKAHYAGQGFNLLLRNVAKNLTNSPQIFRNFWNTLDLQQILLKKRTGTTKDKGEVKDLACTEP